MGTTMNTPRPLAGLALAAARGDRPHAAPMAKFPNMEHDEPTMAHLAPGGAGEIVWTFDRAGDLWFAGLVDDHDDHDDLGMPGTLRVAGNHSPPSPKETR
jgi:uncharacterized cupredoxin-like copper-binding protein